jgi:outer membrane immunogenic protein
MITRTFIAGTLAALAFASPAAAFDWGGFYGGFNIGHAAGSIDTTDNEVSTSGALVGITPGSLNPATTGFFTSADSSADVSGLIGGVQAGYNLQSGAFVFGVEGAFHLADLANSESFYATNLGPLYESTASIDSYATLMARLGVAFDNVLLYGAAGLAVAQGSADLAITGGAPGDPQDTFADSQSRTHMGYAVGVGAAVALSESWSLFAEYQHVGLGEETYDFTFAGSDGSTASSTASFGIHTVKAGINFHF